MRWADMPGLCETEGAHLLMWQRTWPAEMAVVLPELQRLRDIGVPSCSYHLDRWWGLDREHQVDDQPFFRTDLVVSPDDSPRWAEHGVNHLWMPPGVYDAECGLVAPAPRQYRHDVVFVGSYPYPHPEWADYRRGLVETMQARFGTRFGIWPKNRQPLRGRDLQTLYATAKVVIGDSCLAGESHKYFSDRVPETLGRGGLLIHPEVKGIIEPNCSHPMGYSDGQLLTYPLGDFESAALLVEAALDNPDHSAKMAARGRELVLGRDTYTHRMEALLVEVERQFGWRDEGATMLGVATRTDPQEFPLIRLEIGSGAYPTDGFTHLDIDPGAPDVDIVGPAFPLDIPDGSVTEMRCVDVLEHLSYRDTSAALTEWARVLCPGGRMYVQVPDAESIMRWFVADPLLLVDRLPADLPQTALAGAAWRLLGGHADGVQGGDDWTRNAHYSMFSAESLTAALDVAGFDVQSLVVNEHPNLMVWATRR